MAIQDGIATEYYLNGDTMMAEKTGSNLITYLFDENGARYGFLYNSTPYYYVYNGQGDVIRLVNASGTVVAKYEYNAWGKVLAVTDNAGTVQTSSTFIGNINPIRYRGYYYDAETGFYYLQSRYYDPETCRFINADDVTYLDVSGTALGCNLFAYCENNPVINVDKNGKIFMNAILGGIFGAVLSAVVYYIEYWLGMRSWNGWTFAGNVALGAALGALGGYISGYAKFAKVARHARLPKMLKKLKSPIVRNLVVWANKGISYIIKSFVKSLSRKRGESWTKAVRRILGT